MAIFKINKCKVVIKDLIHSSFEKTISNLYFVGKNRTLNCALFDRQITRKTL